MAPLLLPLGPRHELSVGREDLQEALLAQALGLGVCVPGGRAKSARRAIDYTDRGAADVGVLHGRLEDFIGSRARDGLRPVVEIVDDCSVSVPARFDQ